MTKAQLRAAYTEARAKYSAGEFLTNEYALHLDEMLAKHLGLPQLDQEIEED